MLATLCLFALAALAVIVLSFASGWLAAGLVLCMCETLAHYRLTK
jgi:hypothetical protein